MDHQLLKKGLDYAKKRKKWVLICALLGVSSYGAYKVYNLPSVTRKRRKLIRLLRVFIYVIEMLSDSAETIGFVCNDVKAFLKSDSDEIPNSLKQVSKIVVSDECSESLTRVSQALTVGVLRGYGSETRVGRGESGGSLSFVDRVFDRILSNAGTGFVSVVAGSFARNLVLGFRSSEVFGSSNEDRTVNGMVIGGLDSSSMSKFMDVLSSDKGKEFIANCIQVFVGTAVGVYLEKTMDINVYDEVFAGMTNPSHETKVRDVLVSVCNGAVETLIKTAHQVLTSKNTDSKPYNSSSCLVPDGGECSKLNGSESSDGHKSETRWTHEQVSDKVHGGSWGSMVLSTLSVPSNQRFVRDVTGRVTFETVRSLAEFTLLKVSDGLRNSTNVVHDQVKDKGRQVVRYFGLKSYVFVTIYLALFMHIIFGTRSLLPA